MDLGNWPPRNCGSGTCSKFIDEKNGFESGKILKNHSYSFRVWAIEYLGIFQVLLHRNVYEKIIKQATPLNLAQRGIKSPHWRHVYGVKQQFQRSRIYHQASSVQTITKAAHDAKFDSANRKRPFSPDAFKAHLQVADAWHSPKSVVDLL